jgi:hypothetical protein
MKRFLFYLFYIAFVMALTTTAVWTRVGSRSFFVKRRCYVIEGKEPVFVKKCPCECHPGDRNWAKMLCKKCGHFVDADITYFAKKIKQKFSKQRLDLAR